MLILLFDSLYVTTAPSAVTQYDNGSEGALVPGAAALIEVVRERDGDEDVHERSGTEATADRDLQETYYIPCEHIAPYGAGRRTRDDFVSRKVSQSSYL